MTLAGTSVWQGQAPPAPRPPSEVEPRASDDTVRDALVGLLILGVLLGLAATHGWFPSFGRTPVATATPTDRPTPLPTRTPLPQFTLAGIDFTGSCNAGCPMRATVKNYGGPGAGVVTLWVTASAATHNYLSEALASCSTAIPQTSAGGTVSVECTAQSADLANFFDTHHGASVYLGGIVR
jgi:hypothetical protein